MSLIVQFAKIALKEYFLIAKTSEPDILKKTHKEIAAAQAVSWGIRR